MRKMTTKEIQAVSFEILKYIDHFCKERGIRYFLDSGTLIGAARHKGFVPWDDDMDIRIPRPDYEKFVREFMDTKKYKLYAPSRNNCYLSYARVCEMTDTYFEQKLLWTMETPGVGVDVLPLDRAPDSMDEFEKMSIVMNKAIQKLFWFRSLINYDPRFRGGWLGFFKDCCHYAINQVVRLNLRYYMRQEIFKIEKLRQSYQYAKTRYCFSSVLKMSNKGRWLCDWFSDVVYIDFCGEKFPAPIGYDERLTTEYGDWRTPPPISERQTHESNQSMWWR